MRFHCPICRRLLDAAKGTAGRKARCPSCKAIIIVPHLTPDLPPASSDQPPTETSVSMPPSLSSETGKSSSEEKDGTE